MHFKKIRKKEKSERMGKKEERKDVREILLNERTKRHNDEATQGK